MRTTIRVADDLLARAKQRALDQGISLKELVEEALRVFLYTPSEIKTRRKRISLKTFKGKGLKPGVDLDDGASLLSLMEDDA